MPAARCPIQAPSPLLTPLTKAVASLHLLHHAHRVFFHYCVENGEGFGNDCADLGVVRAIAHAAATEFDIFNFHHDLT